MPNNKANKPKSIVKLTTLEDIKEQIENLRGQYISAKRNNDTRKIEYLEKEYKELRKILFSNERYFKKLDEEELEKIIETTNNEKEKEYAESKINQKNVYSSSNRYIKNIDKSTSLNKLIKRRRFKKCILGFSIGAALVAGVFGIKQLNNNKNDHKTMQTSTEITTQDNQYNDNITDSNSMQQNTTQIQENTTSTEKYTIVTPNNSVNQNNSNSNNGSINSNPNNNGSNINSGYFSNPKPLDPGIGDNKPQKHVIPQSTTESAPAVDYPFNNNQNSTSTQETTEETVTTEEKAPEIPKDMPIEENTSAPSTQENTSKPSKQENTSAPSTQETTEETVTTEEIIIEEEAPSYDDDMPIEDDEDDVTYYGSNRLTYHM